MNKVRVKICGITREEDLHFAIDAGTDAVGFVVGVQSSPRNLTIERAEQLIRLVPIFVESVMVMVPNNSEEVIQVLEKVKPDAIQICGEKWLNISILRNNLHNARLIRTVNANCTRTLKVIKEMSRCFDAILSDSFSNGKFGGSGIVHDWKLSKYIRQAIHPKPLILAGGLRPENVKDAIRAVQPYAVDVSSGVELKPGIKDPKKVLHFVNNVKGATI